MRIRWHGFTSASTEAEVAYLHAARSMYDEFRHTDITIFKIMSVTGVSIAMNSEFPKLEEYVARVSPSGPRKATWRLVCRRGHLCEDLDAVVILRK